MNKSECLTRFILTREYNPYDDGIIYNSDLRTTEKMCRRGFSMSIKGEKVLKAICEADNIAWNTMAEHCCSECQFCDEESVEKIACMFDDDPDADNTDIVIFLCQHTKEPK